jgi:integrase
VKVVEAKVLRDRDFTEAEASKILAAALAPHGGRLSAEHAAARRWVPWMCAYSGARVGEITQLRHKDVLEKVVCRTSASHRRRVP